MASAAKPFRAGDARMALLSVNRHRIVRIAGGGIFRRIEFLNGHDFPLAACFRTL